MSKEFYSRLGVASTATMGEIRTAFRRLAKELHPDHNHAADAQVRFQAISEAYHVLADPETRARYDGPASTHCEVPRPEMVDPVQCSRCRCVTAQPRYTVFRSVAGYGIFTKLTSYKGIFCTDCARRTALKASMVSAAAGWWAIPFGPLQTVAEIVCNAFGGYEPGGSRERLLWQNARAFDARGNGELAYGLARLLRTSKDDSTARRAVRLMEDLEHRGVDPQVARLKPARRMSPLATVLQLGLGLIVPAATALAVMQAVQWHWTANAGDASARIAETLPADDIQSLNAGPAPLRKAVPCAAPPLNGDVLQGSANGPDQNRLVIENAHGSNAIVKVRDATTNKVVVSFFVAASSTAVYTQIPDGRYTIQYALGGALDRSCSRFVSISEAAEDPHAETFTTQSNDTGYHRQELRFGLHSVSDDNLRTEPITAAAFNAD